jgi:hypothetical protein
MPSCGPVGLRSFLRVVSVPGSTPAAEARQEGVVGVWLNGDAIRVGELRTGEPER